MRQQAKVARSVLIFKWVMILVVLAIIGLFIQQNMETFVGPQYFRLNLFMSEVMAWNIRLYDLLLLFAVIGFLIGMGIMLKPFLNIRRRLANEQAARAEAVAPANPNTPTEEIPQQAAVTEPEADTPKPEESHSKPTD